MKEFLEITFFMVFVERSSCMRDNYMESYMVKNIQKQTIRMQHPIQHDMCHPLYWYPNNIPEICSIPERARIRKREIDSPLKQNMMPMPMPMPMAMPVPAPLQPLPYGVPIVPPGPMIPVGPQPYPQFPLPFPAMGTTQMNGAPVATSPIGFPPMGMPSMAFPPMGYAPRPFSGVVPGLPGIVSSDGGINIMPFTDVYSDVYEKHKQKMMMRDMEKILKRYEGNSWSKKRKSYSRRLYD